MERCSTIHINDSVGWDCNKLLGKAIHCCGYTPSSPGGGLYVSSIYSVSAATRGLSLLLLLLDPEVVALLVAEVNDISCES